MAGPYYSKGRALAVDAGGTVTVTGGVGGATVTVGPFTLTNATTYPNNTSDGFVARLDTNGNWLWAAQAGGSLSDGMGYPVLDAAGNAGRDVFNSPCHEHLDVSRPRRQPTHHGRESKLRLTARRRRRLDNDRTTSSPGAKP